jgi:hypothetical protein
MQDQQQHCGSLHQGCLELEDEDGVVRFMSFMRHSGWNRLTLGPGAAARLALLLLAGLLAGCEGEVTLDLATDLPTDPNITQIVVNVRGVEFSTSGGGTETLEFRDSQPIDLITLADDSGVFRMFTDEELSEGNYTGVRLLFDEDRLDDAFVSLANGTEYPLNVTQGDHAPLRFDIDDNDNSSESFTLVLDLRKSLSFDDDSDEYTLTPALRAVATEDMSRIEGTLSINCPGSGSLGEGAVYLFEGRNVTPDDIDGAGVEPFATSPVFTAQGGTFFYALRYLPAGDYTLAVTCVGNDEDPLADDDLRFRNATNVNLDEQEIITLDLP